MITCKLRSDIDKLWEEFWTGGITNPLTVIEQISFLMFARMLDINETREEKKAMRVAKGGKKKDWPRMFPEDKQHLRWGNLKELPGAVSDTDAKKGIKSMMSVIRDELFPFFRSLNSSPAPALSKGARYNQPSVVEMYVMSPTRTWLGAATSKSRSRRLGAIRFVCRESVVLR